MKKNWLIYYEVEGLGLHGSLAVDADSKREAKVKAQAELKGKAILMVPDYKITSVSENAE